MTAPTETGRTWVVALPARRDLLNANDRAGHWGRRHRITKAVRRDAYWCAKYVRVPRLGRARIVAELRFPDARGRDPHNWTGTAKAAVDGLRDAGVLPDDTAQHLDGPDMRLGPVERPPGRQRLARLLLHITELHDSE